MSRFVPLTLAVLVAASVGAACSPTGTRQSQADRTSIVLVVLDTVRADHLGLYGYERATTPRLEELATSAIVYDRAYATASWTLPTIASILTGQAAGVHGAGYSVGGAARPTRMRTSVPTIAETLRAYGYATAAVVNAPFLGPMFGFDRGFDVYDIERATDESIRRAGPTVDAALEWLDSLAASDSDATEADDGATAATSESRPFFLLVHLFDAHRHFDAPPPFRGRFTDVYRDRYGETLTTLESRLQAERDGDLDFHIAAYDEELAYIDAEIGRLVDELRERDLWDTTTVVLTADHGEQLGDHDEVGHGVDVYDELVRIPLLVWAPGVEGSRSSIPVSTLDIVPTLLDAATVDYRPRLPGQSLLRGPPPSPTNAPSDEARRTLLIENPTPEGVARALIEWPHKLIVDTQRVAELYDLARDPGETNDLLANEPGRDVRQIARRLRQLLAAASRGGTRGNAAALDGQTLDDLRALGYIQ